MPPAGSVLLPAGKAPRGSPASEQLRDALHSEVIASFRETKGKQPFLVLLFDLAFEGTKSHFGSKGNARGSKHILLAS